MSSSHPLTALLFKKADPAAVVSEAPASLAKKAPALDAKLFGLGSLLSIKGSPKGSTSQSYTDNSICWRGGR